MTLPPAGTRIGLLHHSEQFYLPAVVVDEMTVETLADPEFAKLLVDPAYRLAFDPNYKGARIAIAPHSRWLPAEQCTFQRVTTATYRLPTERQLETYNPWGE